MNLYNYIDGVLQIMELVLMISGLALAILLLQLKM